MAVTVMVVSKGESGFHEGDWAVKVKGGPSKHRGYIRNSSGSIKGFQYKEDAKKRAKQKARGIANSNRKAIVRTQTRSGSFSGTLVSYGG